MTDVTDVVTSTRGPGLPTLLGVAFIVLKLTGVIDWSWLWVLAPLWIPWAILGFFFVLLTILITRLIKQSLKIPLKCLCHLLHNIERTLTTDNRLILSNHCQERSDCLDLFHHLLKEA